MAAYRIPYPVGDTKIRNYIYQPIVARADLDVFIRGLGWPPAISTDARWGIGLTLAQMMALSWRIKKWTLTGSFSLTYTSGFPHSDIVDTGTLLTGFLSGLTTLGSSPAVDERDIIRMFTDGMPFSTRIGPPSLGNTGHYLAFGGNCTCIAGGTSVNTQPFDGQVFLLEDPFSGTQITAYDPLTNLFYPPIDVSFSAFAPSPCSFVVKNAGWDVPPSTRFTMKIDPVIAPAFDIPVALTSGAGTIVSNIVFTASEFFPYKTSTGLPVYDSITGAQLNDPFA